jgi:hypothetical protein
MHQPGIYNLTDAAYHADPCPEPSLSSSIARTIISRSPLHAWYQHPRLNDAHKPDNSKEFDIGTAAHDLILKGQDCLAIINADNFKTKVAREERDAAYAAGLTPLLNKDWDAVQLMATEFFHALYRTRDAQDAFRDGTPEQTLIWKHDGIWFRAKLDWMPKNSRIYDDFKTTTNARSDAFQRRVYEHGYDMQAAFYMRGLRLLGICDDPIFRFIAVEKEAPHGVSINRLSPAAIELADMKVSRAIEIWKRCLHENRWDGYPPITVDIGPPAWEVRDWEEREVNREAMEDLEVDYHGI